MGIRQGCLQSLTKFQLYVEGLEWHLLGNADNDAPTLRVVQVLLWLYFDERISMFTTAAGLR